MVSYRLLQSSILTQNNIPIVRVESCRSAACELDDCWAAWARVDTEGTAIQAPEIPVFFAHPSITPEFRNKRHDYYSDLISHMYFFDQVLHADHKSPAGHENSI